VTRDEDGRLRVDTGLVVLGDRQTKPILPLLLGLKANGPVDRLSRLAETGRAFDEQAPDVLAVLALEPPEEEALDNLMQPSLRLFRREQNGGRGWLQGVQGGRGREWAKRSRSIGEGEAMRAPRPFDRRSRLKGA